MTRNIKIQRRRGRNTRETPRNTGKLRPLTLHEGEDLLVLFFGLTLLHQVDLVLQDEDVLQLHDLDSCQMLRCLGLRTRLVARWQAEQKPSRVNNTHKSVKIQVWPVRVEEEETYR